MIKPKVSDISGIINKIAPFALAEEWDNVGLQVGDPASEAGKIMVSLDPCAGAVESAIAAGCALLLTHHPLIFSPLKKISRADETGNLIVLAIKNDLSILSLHTNYDIVTGGMNDLLAERLGLMDCEPLRITGADELVKLSVFVPKGHEEKVLDALFKYTVQLGAYSECSFRTEGTGTFTPLDGAKPFLGTIGSRQHAEESRIEVLVKRNNIPAAIKALIAIHPYEEPAFDIYPLLNSGVHRGLGRIGTLAVPLAAEDFVAVVKKRLGIKTLRMVGEKSKVIRKVAVCGGSGASLLKEACRRGADALVTGDIKYHEAREAETAGLVLIDAGHFATEIIMVNAMVAALGKALAERRYVAEVTAYQAETEPFSYL